MQGFLLNLRRNNRTRQKFLQGANAYQLWYALAFFICKALKYEIVEKIKRIKKTLTVNLIDTLYFKRNNNFVTGGHNMEILVQTHNLTKQYGQNKAVSNVSLSVNKGEIYGLIGRNGVSVK